MSFKNVSLRLGTLFVCLVFLLQSISVFAHQYQTEEPSSDSCFARRTFGTPVVIHFNGYSRCYLPLGEETGVLDATPVGVRIAGEGLDFLSLPVEKDAGIFSFVVSPETDYEIYSQSSCGQDKKLGNFTSRTGQADLVTASIDAMNALEKWQKIPEGNNFYQMIKDNPLMSTLEKVYLLQQILNKGASFDPQYDNGEVPPKEAFIPPGEEDCSCTTLEFKTARELDAYNECLEYPNFVCTHEESEEENNFWYRLQYKSGVEGPAKFEKVWGGKKRCNGKNFQKMEKERKGIAILRFTMLCLDGRWDPANCRCELPVNVRYSYLSNLSTEVNVGSGWTCDPIIYPGNKAEAYADDAAFLIKLPTISDINNGTFDIDSLFRRTLFNGCGASFEKDRLKDLVGTVFEGLKLALILNGGNDSSGIQNILNTLNLNSTITNLQNYISNLVSEPWTISEGQCGNSTAQLLLEGQRVYQLKVDEPLTVALVTKSFVRVGGQNWWDGVAQVVSGYSLSGVIKGTPVTDENPYCCTPAIASYALGSMGDAYGFGGNMSPSIASRRTKVGNHLMDVAGSAFTNTLSVSSTFGGYIIPDELAQVLGKPIPGCRTSVVGRNDSDALILDDKKSGWSVSADGTFLYLKQQSNADELLHYRVFDMQGRLLNQGVSIGNQTRMMDTNHLPQGYYLVTVSNGVENKTIKCYNLKQ